MKKIQIFLLAAIMLMAGCVVSSAQEKKMHFGVKAGMNFSTVDLTKNDYKKNLGYQAGLALQYDVNSWLSVEPDLLFHIRGVEDKQYGRSQGLGYIEVPINLQFGPRFYNDNIRVFAQAGPYIGYAISNDIKGKEIVNKDGSKTREGFEWSNINRLEYGAAVGLGIKLFAFQLSAEYTWNFGSVASESGIANKSFPECFSSANFSGFNLNLAIIF